MTDDECRGALRFFASCAMNKQCTVLLHFNSWAVIIVIINPPDIKRSLVHVSIQFHTKNRIDLSGIGNRFAIKHQISRINIMSAVFIGSVSSFRMLVM